MKPAPPVTRMRKGSADAALTAGLLMAPADPAGRRHRRRGSRSPRRRGRDRAILRRRGAAPAGQPFQRPGKGQGRIVPREAALALGGVEIGHLVLDLAPGLEGQIAVRIAHRHEELQPVRLGKLRRGPGPAGRRSGPRVDDDVPDPAAHAAHELGLGVRRPLEVQAAQGAGGLGPRVVVLTEDHVQPHRGEPRRVVGFGEPAALVDEAAGGDCRIATGPVQPQGWSVVPKSGNRFSDRRRATTCTTRSLASILHRNAALKARAPPRRRPPRARPPGAPVAGRRRTWPGPRAATDRARGSGRKSGTRCRNRRRAAR